MGENSEPERFATNGAKPTAMLLIGHTSPHSMVVLDPVGCKLAVYNDELHNGSFRYSHDATHAETHQAMADYERSVRTRTNL